MDCFHISPDHELLHDVMHETLCVVPMNKFRQGKEDYLHLLPHHALPNPNPKTPASPHPPFSHSSTSRHWLHQYYRTFSRADAALDKAKQEIDEKEREHAEAQAGSNGDSDDSPRRVLDRAAVNLLARNSDELAEKALACLAGIEGTFAFVIYDSNQVCYSPRVALATSFDCF